MKPTNEIAHGLLSGFLNAESRWENSKQNVTQLEAYIATALERERSRSEGLVKALEKAKDALDRITSDTEDRYIQNLADTSSFAIFKLLEKFRGEG